MSMVGRCTVALLSALRHYARMHTEGLCEPALRSLLHWIRKINRPFRRRRRRVRLIEHATAVNDSEAMAVLAIIRTQKPISSYRVVLGRAVVLVLRALDRILADLKRAVYAWFAAFEDDT